jgi:hypothetical protein
MREVKEYYSHWLPPLLGASATTLGHNIFYQMEKAKVSSQLRRHEMIHVEQCERYTTVGFFIVYFFYYIKFRLNGKSHWEAYRANPLEIEAFAREKEVTK